MCFLFYFCAGLKVSTTSHLNKLKTKKESTHTLTHTPAAAPKLLWTDISVVFS